VKEVKTVSASGAKKNFKCNFSASFGINRHLSRTQTCEKMIVRNHQHRRWK
jgi:hypothetical protein